MCGRDLMWDQLCLCAWPNLGSVMFWAGANMALFKFVGLSLNTFPENFLWVLKFINFKR